MKHLIKILTMALFALSGCDNGDRDYDNFTKTEIFCSKTTEITESDFSRCIDYVEQADPLCQMSYEHAIDCLDITDAYACLNYSVLDDGGEYEALCGGIKTVLGLSNY